MLISAKLLIICCLSKKLLHDWVIPVIVEHFCSKFRRAKIYRIYFCGDEYRGASVLSRGSNGAVRAHSYASVQHAELARDCNRLASDEGACAGGCFRFDIKDRPSRTCTKSKEEEEEVSKENISNNSLHTSRTIHFIPLEQFTLYGILNES